MTTCSMQSTVHMCIRAHHTTFTYLYLDITLYPEIEYWE